MKRLLFVLACASLALAGPACSAAPLFSQPTAAPTLAALPTDAPTMTAAAPVSTATALPSPTPESPTATPLPPAIDAQTAAGLQKRDEFGSTSTRKIVFSPDGEVFVTAGGNDNDYAVKFWPARGGQMLRALTDFRGIVWDAAFSPDGAWIATAADDPDGRRVRVWNASDGSLLADPGGPRIASSLAFSPDGTRLAVGGVTNWPQGGVYLYDTSTWNLIQTLEAPGQNVTAVAFTPDGSRLISAGTDGRIRVWSASDGSAVNSLFGGKQANRLALSPNGRLLASSFCSATDTYGCVKGGVNVWRASDGTLLQTFPDLAESLAFSPDGSLLASASGANDPAIRLRRTDDWSLVRTLEGQTYSAAFSPDGRLLVTADWNKVDVWSLP